MVDYIFLIVLYLFLGRVFGFEIYRHELISFLIENKFIKYESRHSWNDTKEFEKNIKPKMFRNILRIISILIWPILTAIVLIYFIVTLIVYLFVSFIKFFTE